MKDQYDHGVRRAHASNVDLHLLFGTWRMHDATTNRERRASVVLDWAFRLERYDVRVYVLAVLYQRPVAHDCGQVV